MKFYDCKNQEINKDKFIFLYSNIYYSINSLTADDLIADILVNGINSIADISTILTWKMGNLFKLQIQEENTAKLRSHTVNLKDLFDTVKNNNGKVLFDELVKTTGLGPVYSSTLLFFKSKMEYPIYDKFASVALNAIVKNDDISVPQEYHYQNDPKAFWSVYKNYRSNLETVFGEDYKTDRSIDQALWAYGHYFKITEK